MSEQTKLPLQYQPESAKLAIVRDYIHEFDKLPPLRVMSEKMKMKMGTLSCYICLLRKHGYKIETKRGGGFTVVSRANRNKVVCTTGRTAHKKRGPKPKKPAGDMPLGVLMRKKEGIQNKLPNTTTIGDFTGCRRGPKLMNDAIDSMHDRLDDLELKEDRYLTLAEVVHKMELVDSSLIQRTEHTENRVKEFSGRLLTLCENERFKHRARALDLIIKGCISASLLGLFILQLINN